MSKKEDKDDEKIIIESMKSLLNKLGEVEVNYKTQKLRNKLKRNELLLNIDWGEVNDERKKDGLTKLSNNELKNAYIDNKLAEDLLKEVELELEYNELRRIYEVSLKYSLDVLR